MNKKFFLLFIIFFSVPFLFSSCKKKAESFSEENQEQEVSDIVQQTLDAKKTNINAGFVPGPQSLPFVYFIENKNTNKNFNLKTQFYKDKASLLSALLKNQVNAAILETGEVHKILSSLPESLVIAGAAGTQGLEHHGHDSLALGIRP